MSKDLVPRFTCPLCGWLAYWSMLEKGPHKPKIRGMKYGGFQEISYHSVWSLDINRTYKQFLRLKVRELAKKLGLKLADEIDVDAVEEEEEIEVDTERVIEDDLDKLAQELLGSGATSPVVRKAVRHSAGHAAGGVEDISGVEGATMSQVMQAISMIRLQESSGKRIQRSALNRVIETDFEFVKGGENDG